MLPRIPKGSSWFGSTRYKKRGLIESLLDQFRLREKLFHCLWLSIRFFHGIVWDTVRGGAVNTCHGKGFWSGCFKK